MMQAVLQHRRSARTTLDGILCGRAALRVAADTAAASTC